jgi:glycosyltransferase involved in cell wall biosynthesis
MTGSRREERAVPVTFISSNEQEGGAEVIMRSLMERLGPPWIRSVIFFQDGPFATQLRSNGYPVEIVPARPRLGLLAGALRLRRALRRRAAGVIHANGVRAALVAALATAGTRRRIVWLKVDCARDGWLARLIATRCRAVVGISNAVNETFRGRIRKRVHVTYPGAGRYQIDRAKGRTMAIELLGCPPDAELVVVSGRLWPSKGQLDLVEMTPRLVAERPGLRVALLGGETREYPGFEELLRRRARALDIERAVAFLGHRGGADALRFVSGCDVLVAPSRREAASGWKEGFGLAPVEAMSAGTPVVAYRNGSFPEVLGECAYLVAEADTDALAAAILRVLGDDSLRQRLVDCGRRRVRDRYRWEDAARSMKRHYLAAELAR